MIGFIVPAKLLVRMVVKNDNCLYLNIKLCDCFLFAAPTSRFQIYRNSWHHLYLALISCSLTRNSKYIIESNYRHQYVIRDWFVSNRFVALGPQNTNFTKLSNRLPMVCKTTNRTYRLTLVYMHLAINESIMWKFSRSTVNYGATFALP